MKYEYEKAPWPYTDGNGRDFYMPRPPARDVPDVQPVMSEYEKRRPVRHAEKTLKDGTEIRVATPRVGDDEREWVARKLDEMWARGFLSGPEHAERHGVAGEARTAEEPA